MRKKIEAWSDCVGLLWLVHFLYRLKTAVAFYNFRYWQILKWLFSSKEITNLTYQLEPANIQYLCQCVCVVTGKSYEEIWGYIEELNASVELKDHIWAKTLTSTNKRVADGMNYYGRRMGWYAIARAIKPRTIVETGVDKGLGSVVLCHALMKNKAEGHSGQYFGTDINPQAGYLLAGEYKLFGQILYGDSLESLKTLGHIDLFINDSDHSSQYEYDEYQTIVKKIDNKSILLGDNAHCSSELSRFSRETNRKFLFFKEVPRNHWYPGAGIGISFV